MLLGGRDTVGTAASAMLGCDVDLALTPGAEGGAKGSAWEVTVTGACLENISFPLWEA